MVYFLLVLKLTRIHCCKNTLPLLPGIDCHPTVFVHLLIEQLGRQNIAKLRVKKNNIKIFH